MKSNMTTNSQLWTTEPKQNKNKNELSKQLEQEQIHRDRVHLKGYQRVCAMRVCLILLLLRLDAKLQTVIIFKPRA